MPEAFFKINVQQYAEDSTELIYASLSCILNTVAELPFSINSQRADFASGDIFNDNTDCQVVVGYTVAQRNSLKVGDKIKIGHGTEDHGHDHHHNHSHH
mgnify:CR=1 FL=1